MGLQNISTVLSGGVVRQNLRLGPERRNVKLRHRWRVRIEAHFDSFWGSFSTIVWPDSRCFGLTAAGRYDAAEGAEGSLPPRRRSCEAPRSGACRRTHRGRFGEGAPQGDGVISRLFCRFSCDLRHFGLIFVDLSDCSARSKKERRKRSECGSWRRHGNLGMGEYKSASLRSQRNFRWACDLWASLRREFRSFGSAFRAARAGCLCFISSSLRSFVLFIAIFFLFIRITPLSHVNDSFEFARCKRNQLLLK